MFYTKALNNFINGLHETALRITYPDRISTFDQSLKIDHLASIHHRNLQYLLI